jgi:hypothetical protein
MKPVAWTDGKGNYFDKTSSFPVDDLIPLYTHPANIIAEILEKNKPEIEKANAHIKSLEDEIKALKAKTLTDFEIRGVMALDECWIGEDCSTPDMIAFARAILREAQSNCNGFCGEYECKENQANCKRLKKSSEKWSKVE